MLMVAWTFVILCVATAAKAPGIIFTKGYAFGNAESHPHAGVETKDGGFLMVGDGVRLICACGYLLSHSH